MDKKVFNIGLLGAIGTLTIEDGFLSYRHPYGRTFRVPVDDIVTVTVDVMGWSKGILKIVGRGSELASAEMPIPWANKCQAWILANLRAQG